MAIPESTAKRKRVLRVLFSPEGARFLGECVRCGRRFKAHDSEGRNMVDMFDAHVCSRDDVRRTEIQIVSRAGMSFFNS